MPDRESVLSSTSETILSLSMHSFTNKTKRLTSAYQISTDSQPFPIECVVARGLPFPHWRKRSSRRLLVDQRQFGYRRKAVNLPPPLVSSSLGNCSTKNAKSKSTRKVFEKSRRKISKEFALVFMYLQGPTGYGLSRSDFINRFVGTGRS